MRARKSGNDQIILEIKGSEQTTRQAPTPIILFNAIAEIRFLYFCFPLNLIPTQAIVF
jgi:hypothetical protein